jgi:hypothetical protein
LASIDHRHQQRRPRVGHPELAGGDSQTGSDIGDPLGPPALQHLPGCGAGDRQTHTTRLANVTGARLHDQLLAIALHDHDALRVDEHAPTLDDQLEHVLQGDLPADRERHIAGRLESPERPLRLCATTLAGLIQPGVVDRDRRPIGQDHRGLLVLLGELAAALLGQVQVAPHLPANHDRHTEEAAHHRMPRREAVARRVLTDLREA